MNCECHNCGDVHRLAAREAVDGTTACPSCGAKPYSSLGTSSEAATERLRSVVSDVDGVGEQTVDRLARRYAHVTALAETDKSSLTDVPHVGPQTARAIHEAAKNGRNGE